MCHCGKARRQYCGNFGRNAGVPPVGGVRRIVAEKVATILLSFVCDKIPVGSQPCGFVINIRIIWLKTNMSDCGKN